MEAGRGEVGDEGVVQDEIEIELLAGAGLARSLIYLRGGRRARTNHGWGGSQEA